MLRQQSSSLSENQQAALINLLILESNPKHLRGQLHFVDPKRLDPMSKLLVGASLLANQEADIRLAGANIFKSIPEDFCSTKPLLFHSFRIEGDLELQETLREYLGSSSEVHRLAEYYNTLRFTSSYAKERNMEVLDKEKVSSNILERTLVTFLDASSSCRNAAAYCLGKHISKLSEYDQNTALAHIVYGLQTPVEDQQTWAFKSFLLNCVSSRIGSHLALRPIVCSLQRSKDYFLRVDSAVTALLLSSKEQKELTKAIIQGLREPYRLSQSEQQIFQLDGSVQRQVNENEVELQAETSFIRDGLPYFIEKKLGIELTPESIEEFAAFCEIRDQKMYEFLNTADEIVERSREALEESGRRTESLIATYRRASLIRIASVALEKLEPANQRLILNEFGTIMLRLDESPIVKCQAIEAIERATEHQSDLVVTIIMTALTEQHVDEPEIRSSAYKTLGKLEYLTPEAHKVACAALEMLGTKEDVPEVADVAVKALGSRLEREHLLNTAIIDDEEFHQQ